MNVHALGLVQAARLAVKSATLASLLILACRSQDPTEAPASDQGIAIGPEDVNRMNQPLQEALKIASPTTVLEVSISLKFPDQDVSAAVTDAEREQRMAELERRTKSALDQIHGDLVGLGAEILGSQSRRPVYFARVPAGKIPQLLADPRIDRVDLGTLGTRDANVKLSE